MLASEFREMSEADLHTELEAKFREQFNLRMQKGSGQLGSPAQIKSVRRDIARIKTLMNELKRAGSAK